MRGVRVKFSIIENIWQASLSYPVLSFFNDGLKDGIIPSVHKQVTIDLSKTKATDRTTFTQRRIRRGIHCCSTEFRRSTRQPIPESSMMTWAIWSTALGRVICTRSMFDATMISSQCSLSVAVSTRVCSWLGLHSRSCLVIICWCRVWLEICTHLGLSILKKFKRRKRRRKDRVKRIKNQILMKMRIFKWGGPSSWRQLSLSHKKQVKPTWSPHWSRG